MFGKNIFVHQNSRRQQFKLSHLKKKKHTTKHFPIVTAVLKLRGEKQVTN